MNDILVLSNYLLLSNINTVNQYLNKTPKNETQSILQTLGSYI